MAVEDCIKDIMELVPDATRRQALDIIKELADLKAQDPDNFLDVARDLLGERASLYKAFVKEVGDNAIKLDRNLKFIEQPSFKGDKVEALKAILGGSARLSKGGNLSVDRLRKVQATKWRNQLSNKLDSEGLLDTYKSGALDEDVFEELFSIDKNTPVTKSKEAFRIAQVINGIQKNILRTLQRAGSSIQELENYIMKQLHDPGAVRDAGFIKWKKDIMPLLNPKKTFRRLKGKKGQRKFVALKTAEIEQFMKDVYDDIIKGRIDNATGSSTRGTINVDKRVSSHRKLHFNSGKDFFKYNTDLGYGVRTLNGSILQSIDQSARNASLMKAFGTNPREGFDQLVKRARRSITDPAELDKFDNDLEGGALGIGKVSTLYTEVEGGTRIPGRNVGARIGRGLRALQDMALLGKAAIVSITDWAGSASVISSATGKGWMETFLQLPKEFLESVPKKNRKEFARILSQEIEDYLADHASRFNVDDRAPGLMGRAHRQYFRLNLLSTQTESGKLAVAKIISRELAANSSKKFDDIGRRMKANLERYGVDEASWDMMKNSVDDIEGRGKFMTPEAVMRMSDEDVGKIIKKHGLETTPEQFRDKVEQQVASYLQDHAELGSPTAGARQRNILLNGLEANSFYGQLARYFAQFKTFPVTMHNIASRVALSDPDKAAQTLTQALKGKGDTQNMVKFMLGTTSLAGVAMMAKDVFDGKEPRDFKSAEFLTEAFVRGGAGGIWVDFMLGEYDKYGRSFTSDAVGPVLSNLLNPAAEIFASARKGDSKAASKAMWMAINNFPGQNLFQTKVVLDKLLLLEMKEQLSPGYIRRMEKRMREKPGVFNKSQQFLHPFFKPKTRLKAPGRIAAKPVKLLKKVVD